MGLDLFKAEGNTYIVRNDEETTTLPNVDEACDFLLNIGVPDEQIDLALIHLAHNKHTRAQFGVLRKEFIFTDDRSWHETV